MLDIVIVSNSPGELAGWTLPVVRAILAREPRAHIYLFIPPCPFASGREVDVASSIPGVLGAFGSRDYLKYALLARKPRGFTPSGRGVVVYLGGDFMHAAILSWRLRYPAVAYTDRTAGFPERFSIFMAEDERVAAKLLKKGVRKDKIKVVGSLMRDAVVPTMNREEARRWLGCPAGHFSVLLLPGSRPAQIRYVTPFLLRVAELIHKVEPRTSFYIALSPFVSVDDIEKAVSRKEEERFIEGARGLLLRDEKGARVITASGLSVDLVSEGRYDAMIAQDLAISMPGTITAELGCLGIPTVVILPLNRPQEVPLPGVWGMLGGIPFIGGYIQRQAVLGLLGRIEFAAIPNKRAREHIMPELRGVLKPEDVAIRASELIADTVGRSRMSSELAASMGDPGASGRVADIILQVAGEGYRGEEHRPETT